MLFACCAHAAAQTTASSPTVESLLQSLRQQGIEVIYSSELVPPELMAPPSRPGATPLQRVMEALAASGLEMRAVGPSTYVIKRAEVAAPVAAPAADQPLDEISVYASRFAIESGISESHQLSSTDIQLVPGSYNDALHALRALPGLAGNASVRPYIRGSLSEDVLVRYDGIPLVDPFHFKNFQSLISAIDPQAVDRIEVFSGGFPVRYGTRSGGVIDIAPATIDSGYENRANLSMISGGVSSIGKSDRLPLEWLAVVRRSTLDLLEPVEVGFGKPQFSDMLGRLRWTDGDGAWTLGWLLLDDRMALGAADDSESANAVYRDEYVWLARDQKFSDELETRATVVITSSERDRRGTLAQAGVGTGELEETSGFHGFQFANDWKFAPSSGSAYNFGVEFAKTASGYKYARHSEFAPDVAAAFGRAANERVDYSRSPKVSSFALYVANRRKWSRLDAELGLRFDQERYELGGTKTQVSPRLNLRFDLNDKVRLYGSAGRFTQQQHVEEWRVEEGQQLPDPAQVSIHSVLGLEFDAAAATRLGIEVYDKHWTTVAPYFDSELDPFSLLPDLAPDRVRLAPHASEASGLEMNLRKSFDDAFSGWATLTWSHVSDEFQSGEALRSWDQPLSLSTGLAWKGTRASISGLAAWHRGWPRTPVSSSRSPGAGAPTLDLEPRNSDRWDNFFTLDFRGSWTWQFASGDLSAVLDVTNSTHRDNECCSVLENDLPLQHLSSEVNYWLPTIVNLGFTFSW